MAEIPTQAELTASLGDIFVFSSAAQGDWTLAAQLIEVGTGVPMSRDYVCYTALFALPAGVGLQQDVYRIAPPAGDAWELLATPYQPTPEGRAVMGAVFHCRAEAAEVACPV